MGQPAPEKLAVPRTAIRAPGKPQAQLVVAADDAERRSLAREQIEDRADGPLNFLVWIEHDLVAVKDKSDRQCEAQLAFGSLIELAAMEAGADNVQFRLRERALHPQNQDR